MDHASFLVHSHFAHRHTSTAKQASTSIVPMKLDCPSSLQATADHHRSRLTSYTELRPAVVHKSTVDRLAVIQASSSLNPSACLHLKRHPSSSIIAFVAVISAFAFTGFAPQTFGPFS